MVFITFAKLCPFSAICLYKIYLPYTFDTWILLIIISLVLLLLLLLIRLSLLLQLLPLYLIAHYRSDFITLVSALSTLFVLAWLTICMSCLYSCIFFAWLSFTVDHRVIIISYMSLIFLLSLPYCLVYNYFYYFSVCKALLIYNFGVHYTHTLVLLTSAKSVRSVIDVDVNFDNCYYKFYLPSAFFVVLCYDVPYATTDYYFVSIYGRSILSATVGEASLYIVCISRKVCWGRLRITLLWSFY